MGRFITTIGSVWLSWWHIARTCFDDHGAEVAWDRVDVVSDERWVPEHQIVQTRLIKDRLLTGPAAAAHLVPLFADGDIKANCQNWQRALMFCA